MAITVVAQIMRLVDERKPPNKEILKEAAVLMSSRDGGIAKKVPSGKVSSNQRKGLPRNRPRQTISE
jgi:hypothetical protein